MSDLIRTFKAFSVAVIEELRIGGLKLPLPVTVQLSDISAVPFVELVVHGPTELGIWAIDVKPLPGTLWKQGPHTAKFTAEGIRPFTRDFSWSPQQAAA